MSEVYGAEAGYGLMIFADERQDFAKKLAKRRECAEEDALDVLFDEGLTNLSHNNGYESWYAVFLANTGLVSDESDGDACVIYAEKQGGVTKDTADLYSSLDEMADEFRQRYGDCLPQDFDYIGHLCFLRASYACW